MEYKVGDILATKMPTYISKFIRFVLKSEYSHLALIISDTEVLEEDGIAGFTRIRPIEIYKNYSDIYTCDSLTDKQREDIVKYSMSKIGEKYDYYLLFVLFMKYAFGLRIRYKDNEADICSELVNDCYFEGAGITLSKKRFPIPDDVIKKLTYVEEY